MLTTWKEINDLAGSDNNFVITIDLSYGNAFIIVRYGDNFKCANIRQEDRRYKVKEAIRDTIIQLKKELKEEY